MLHAQKMDIKLNLKNKPRPIGEVIKDLIREGLILPNYKTDKL